MRYTLILLAGMALVGCGASTAPGLHTAAVRVPIPIVEDAIDPSSPAEANDERLETCSDLYEHVDARRGAPDAEAVLAAARERVPGCVVADWLEAQIARDLGDTQRSFAALDRVALATDADAVRADRIATALAVPGEPGARRALLDCDPMPAGDEASRIGCAVAALRLGDPRRAERWLLEALVIEPRSFEAWADLGQMLLDHRDYEGARVALAHATRLAPDDYESWLALGAAERGRQDPEAADAAYVRAMELDPARPEAFYDRGLLYESFRDGSEPSLRQAQEFYRQFVARAAGRFAAQVDDVAHECPVTWPPIRRGDRGAFGRRRRSTPSCVPGRVQDIDGAMSGPQRDVATMQADLAAMQAQAASAPAPSAPSP